MWYNQACHTNGNGGVLLFRQRRHSTIDCWATRPPEQAPAVRVTASARSFGGRFAMPAINCHHCGKSFDVIPARLREGAKFCSRDCYYAHRWGESGRKETVICLSCEKSFERAISSIRDGGNFCSQQCWYSWRSKRIKGDKLYNYKPKIQLNCDQCGDDIERHESDTKGRKNIFCSRECHNQFMSGIKGESHPLYKQVEYTCERCGSSFTTHKSRDGVRFCSMDCSSKHFAEILSNEMSGENHPNWQGGHDGYRGKNWSRQSKRARKRDEYTCQGCGVTEEEYGQALDVHHMVPFKNFDGDYKEANKLDNLISFCKGCHTTAEPRHYTNARRALEAQDD